MSFAVGCKSKATKEEGNVDTLPAEAILAPVLLLRDSLVVTNDYTYFIPSTLSDSAAVVCLVFFDPHGDGKVPVSMYKNGLATKFGFALFGSNISKNGMGFDQTRQVASQLLVNVERFFPGKTAIYFCGFSGGAKVALNAGMAMPNVKGVIYAGAPGFAPTITKPVFGFAGTEDMNYSDLLNYNQALPASPAHYLFEYTGKHEWPAPAVFENTFDWINLRERHQNLDYDRVALKILKQIQKEKDPLHKEALLLHLAFLATEVTHEFKNGKELKLLHETESYKEANRKKQQALKHELELKSFYGQAFSDKDINWWEYEITKLKSVKDADDPGLNTRLLGYFSLAAYSLSNRALATNELEVAEKILRIYQLADPENSEQAYLRAVFMARTGSEEGVVGCLKEAISLGFKDKRRIQSEAAFQPFLVKGEVKAFMEKM